MASFQVRGLTPQGQLQERLLSAGSQEEAGRIARQAGLEVLDIKAAGINAPLGRSRHRFDLALFCHELIALLRAGLSLIETLETLAERQQEAQQNDVVLTELVRRMQEGRSFSHSLEAFPALFPELFVASIAASEQTGEMVDALERYLRYHDQVSVIRQKIISASLYPAMLLLVGAGVGLFLLCFLVPRFSHVYEGMDTKLPLASRLLMQWGLFAGEHAWLVTGGLVLMVVLLVSAVRHPGVQRRFMSALQRNRWIGAQLRLMQLSRFYRSLGLLLRGGIPAIKALRMTQPLLSGAMQMSLGQAIQDITQGKSLSDSLQRFQLTTPVALRLLHAGERNGQLADMLEQIAAFHDKEVGHWIDRFTRLFEPLLMLFIGGIIGGIVILLYLPIFELAGSL
ncbi:MAG: type II secretion system F family protein [bacterium]|nr:type II secretion system F family protein [bacterium]